MGDSSLLAARRGCGAKNAKCCGSVELPFTEWGIGSGRAQGGQGRDLRIHRRENKSISCPRRARRGRREAGALGSKSDARRTSGSTGRERSPDRGKKRDRRDGSRARPPPSPLLTGRLRIGLSLTGNEPMSARQVALARRRPRTGKKRLDRLPARRLSANRGDREMQGNGCPVRDSLRKYGHENRGEDETLGQRDSPFRKKSSL